MLAVVQHQQDAAWPQVVRQHVGQRPGTVGAQSQSLGNRLRNQRRIAQQGQLRQPDAVWKGVLHFFGHLERESSLAAAARSGQGHQPMVVQKRFDRQQRFGAANETRQLDRKVCRRDIKRVQARKVSRQAGNYHLVEVFQVGQAFHAVFTHVTQSSAGRQRIGDLASYLG